MMQKMLDAMAKPIHQMAHEQCAKDKNKRLKDKLPADCEARLNRFMDNMKKQISYDDDDNDADDGARLPETFTKGDMDAPAGLTA